MEQHSKSVADSYIYMYIYFLNDGLDRSHTTVGIKHERENIKFYYPYRAFSGQNKIVYSTRFVTRTAIILLLPGNNMCHLIFDV